MDRDWAASLSASLHLRYCTAQIFQKSSLPPSTHLFLVLLTKTPCINLHSYDIIYIGDSYYSLITWYYWFIVLAPGCIVFSIHSPILWSWVERIFFGEGFVTAQKPARILFPSTEALISVAERTGGLGKRSKKAFKSYLFNLHLIYHFQ